MKVGELIKKLNKRDKTQTVYYIDKYGKHEITDVQPMLTKNGSVTIIMNGDGGRYNHKTEPQTEYKKWEASPKVDLPTGEITTCVSVLASALEDESQTEYKKYLEKIKPRDPHKDW